MRHAIKLHVIKPICLAAVLLLPLAAQSAPPPTDAPDNPTAYAAMRLVGKKLGGDSLNQIIEISGHDGVPQPFVWKVVVKDKDSVQEVDVAGGKIAGQRTVDHSPSAGLPAIRLQDLNLDSSGAFETADTQARKVRLRFDFVQYILRAGESGKPVWTLDLMDRDEARIGGMRLAASDGATVSLDGRLASNPLPPAPETPPGQSAPPPATIAEDDDSAGGFFTRTGRTLDHANETVKRNLRKAGSRVQHFFHLRGDDDSTSVPPSGSPD